MKTMLDWHPDIESFAKVLSRRDPNLRHINHGEITTWQLMTDTYNGVWVASEHLKVCDRDGNIAEYNDALLDSFDMPSLLISFTPPDSPGAMIMNLEKEFFDYKKYMWINTNVGATD